MSALLNPVDLMLVAALVGAAASFLIYRLFKPAPPACHTLAGMNTSTKAPDVILGKSLAQGLKRAQQKARSRARGI